MQNKIIVSLVLCAFTILLISSCKKEVTPFQEQVLLNYFDPDVSNYPTGNPEAAAASVREQAMRLYKDANFEQAIVLFDEIFPDSPTEQDRFMWLYYKANAQVALRQLKPAEKTLSYIGQGYSRYNKVEWLQALIAVRLGDNATAMQKLQRLQYENQFKDRATEIIQALEKEKNK